MAGFLVPAILGAVGAAGSLAAGEDAEDAAHQAAQNSNMLEMARFDEAMARLDELYKAGDEAATQAYVEGLAADLGAQRFEDFSRQFADKYAKSATENAVRREQAATQVYTQIQDAANARQNQGKKSAKNILSGGQQILDAADKSAQLQTDAFGRTESRYQPFMDSEKNAINQLQVEMGLTEGDVNRGYRDTPAYMQTMDASRVAEQDARDAIDTAAGNTGTLYSGTRGAALMDRANRGSWERAGVEQSYYSNYMNLLRDMANPVATGTVAGADMNTAGNIGAQGMSAAGANADAIMNAENVRLGTMKTGAEGANLLDYMRTGTEGAPFDMVGLQGTNMGTAGSPYRMQGQDYKFQAKSMGPAAATGAYPTGQAANNYMLQGVEAKNAATADAIGGLTNMYMMNQFLNSPNTGLPANNANYNQWDNFYMG
jgi:hypothetical protein